MTVQELQQTIIGLWNLSHGPMGGAHVRTNLGTAECPLWLVVGGDVPWLIISGPSYKAHTFNSSFDAACALMSAIEAHSEMRRGSHD